jgi:hypothetical protein
MRSEDKKQKVWWGHNALFVAWLVIFLGMVVQSIVTNRDPWPVWFLFGGALLVFTGVHMFYFRTEYVELSKEAPRRWPSTNLIRWAWIGPKFLALSALFLVIIGIFLMIRVLF